MLVLQLEDLTELVVLELHELLMLDFSLVIDNDRCLPALVTFILPKWYPVVLSFYVYRAVLMDVHIRDWDWVHFNYLDCRLL